jgi:hypothetical protein
LAIPTNQTPEHYSPQPGARIKLFDYPQHYTIWHYAKDDSEPK